MPLTRLIIKNFKSINLDVTEWGYLWGVLGELGKVSNAERKTIETKINDILLDESQEISRKLKEITDIFSAADVSVKPAIYAIQDMRMICCFQAEYLILLKRSGL